MLKKQQNQESFDTYIEYNEYQSKKINVDKLQVETNESLNNDSNGLKTPSVKVFNDNIFMNDFVNVSPPKEDCPDQLKNNFKSPRARRATLSPASARQMMFESIYNSADYVKPFSPSQGDIVIVSPMSIRPKSTPINKNIDNGVMFNIINNDNQGNDNNALDHESKNNSDQLLNSSNSVESKIDDSSEGSEFIEIEITQNNNSCSYINNVEIINPNELSETNNLSIYPIKKMIYSCEDNKELKDLAYGRLLVRFEQARFKYLWEIVSIEAAYFAAVKFNIME